jgi:hypothetical protein
MSNFPLRRRDSKPLASIQIKSCIRIVKGQANEISASRLSPVTSTVSIRFLPLRDLVVESLIVTSHPMGSSRGLEWFFALPFLPQVKPSGWVFYSAKSLNLGNYFCRTKERRLLRFSITVRLAFGRDPAFCNHFYVKSRPSHA